MRLDIRYTTHFVYPTPVWDSQNAVRAKPLATADQEVFSYDLTVEPPADVRSFVDRWGTRVDTFGIADPHTELIVTVTTAVETSEPDQPPSEATLGELAAETAAGTNWMYLQYGRHTEWTPSLVDAARDVIDQSGTVVEACRSISKLVNSALAYVPGSTTIGVSPAAVWEQGSGVCQDFAHVTIALLRSHAIPARYVSGYFYAADPSAGDAPDGSEITVQTHAWVEAWVPGHGWWGIDPTNQLATGERHVIVGQGRDYDDVLPMRGVYYGETDHALATEVVMTVDGLGPRSIPAVPGIEAMRQAADHQQ